MYSALQIQVLTELGLADYLPKQLKAARLSGGESASPVPVEMLKGLSSDLSSDLSAEGPGERSSTERTEDQVASPEVPAIQQEPEAVNSPVESIEFTFSCLFSDRIFLIIEMHNDSDHRLLASLMRILSPKKNVQKIRFVWPQVPGETHLDTARKAFGTFLRLQLRQLNSPLVLLMGELPAFVLNAQPSEKIWNGFPMLAVREMSQLHSNATAKKQLWLAIQESLHPSNQLSESREASVSERDS